MVLLLFSDLTADIMSCIFSVKDPLLIKSIFDFLVDFDGNLYL